MPGQETGSHSRLVAFEAVEKRFGSVQALAGATFDIGRAECLGLVGHNGAGKSTLIHVLNGTLAPSAGRVRLAERSDATGYDAVVARDNGIRCVFQELSLAPNLSVAENTRVLHPSIRGFGWRRRAAALIRAALDEIFPGHRISAHAIVGDLSLTERQMVEIARAFTATDRPPRLVILDEPTSSLDQRTASQLLAHVRRRVDAGMSVLFVSHMLGEVLELCGRVTVMSDGRVVDTRDTAGLTRDDLVSMMGGRARERAASADGASRIGSDAPVVLGDARVNARKGEIIGLGGLAGHGQTDLLVDLFSPPLTAFVAGDRQRDGVFPFWSIADNIGVGSLRSQRRGPLLDRERGGALATDWGRRMRIRASSLDAPILSLSGGNQQKALFARALASAAPVILMDDPMRGVDISTRQDVYDMIRAEAGNGRTFVWYSTDTSELLGCDRVLVMRESAVVAELAHDEISEARVLDSSF